jgi:alpha 1,3-mannosyltransferase
MLHRRLYSVILALATISALYFWPYLGASISSSQFKLQSPQTSLSASSPNEFFDLLAQYFVDYPPNGSSYGDQFGELGSRIRILREWISISDSRGGTLDDTIEQVMISMFPFLRNPSKPNNTTPFSSLRKTFTPGSHGIVIPTGLGTFRFACHLVLAIRNVHKSNLPIQIVYAGDDDLPLQHRQLLADLVKNVEFLDVLQALDDKTLKLAGGGWAIKAFAVLASKYENIILLDADAVFVQRPDAVFEQQSYKDTGALLYHDRLLWQHAFRDRHNWWEKQMEHHTPSLTLLKSLVWMEDYAEEGDSGLVVVDKGRLSVLMGLLHICWQNTYAVREEITYKLTYGDKESWWFGFELSGTPFTFEKHYGSIIGWKQIDESDESEKVCSFTIAHTDDDDKLLWYNGSLLRNKAVDNETFEMPTHWMMNATWLKGGSKPEISCMKDGKPRELTADEMNTIEKSIGEAKRFDDLAQPLLT